MISTGLFCNLIYADTSLDHIDHGSRSWTIKTGEGWATHEFTFTVPTSSTDRSADQIAFYSNPQNDKGISYLIDNFVATRVE